MLSANRFKLYFLCLLLLFLCIQPGVAWALSIITTELPVAHLHTPYNFTLSVTGATNPTWSLAAGSGRLPGGIVLGSDGRLHGTAIESGTFPITVRVHDHTTGNSVSRSFSLVATTMAATTPIITTNLLPQAQLNAAYSATLAALHGQTPYTWSIQSGSLPPGLALSAAGTISGHPTAAGSFSFVVMVRDNLGQTATRTFSLSVGSLIITTEELPTASRLGFYRETLHAAGGVGRYSWSLQGGSLPPGLSLLGEGFVAGVPTAAGSFSFTVRARDGAGHSDAKTLTLRVADIGVIHIVTEELPVLIPGRSSLLQLEASGGEPPFSWSLLTGKLPRNLILHKNGVISGTVPEEGEYSFTVQVFDQSGLFREKSYLLRVSDTVNGKEPEHAREQQADREGVRVYIRGQLLKTETPPFLAGGKTFVPLRDVSTALQAQVSWDNFTGEAVIKRGATVISLYPGKIDARINGRSVALDAPLVYLNRRLMIPLRFLAVALDEPIRWDNRTREVVIGRN
ncbi:MAG TPA: hypothetical protein DCQ14_02440 [Firmicutes bacterium]|nr:hypothetical protein [Bacillota bacterium]